MAGKRRGRPSLYTPEVAEEICRRLALGESLKSICEDAHIPTRETVYQWLFPGVGDFPDRYARAREAQAETLADEIVAVADEATDRDNAQAVKVRVDARIWAASKLAPKKYGTLERHDITLRRSVADATDADLLAIALGGQRGGAPPEDDP